MKRYVLRIDGCHPRPLASYLKAIGVLRAITQTDASARGFWKDDTFHLFSTLHQASIQTFFLEHYSPTPLVAPWNGGSGFYPKDRKTGVEAIVKSTADRFADYRAAILAAQAIVGDREASPKDTEKSAMLREAANRWRGKLAEWFTAALVIDAEGSPSYPAILGTGGNDGRLDFTNNFMQRLDELFDLKAENSPAHAIARDHLREALFDDAINGLKSVAIGQFDPGAAGGTNSSAGFGTSSSVNLWDFVLMLEGTIAFSPSLTRKSSNDGMNVMKNPKPGLPLAAAPFAVFNAAAGYATAVGDEKSRGEQWMPLWDRPTTYQELRVMLGQARCRVGNSPAKRPRDVAQAIARAGVSRGFTAFERYGYLERNGQANLATPLGRWEVGAANPHAYLLDEIGPWVERLERAAAGKTAPESWARHSRIIDESIMRCCRPGATPAAWADLAQSIGEAEVVVIRNPGAAAKSFLQPMFYGTRGLRPSWIVAMSDRSTPRRAAELRLAIAMACQGGPLRSRDTYDRVDRGVPIRSHFLPLATQNDRVRVPHRFAASEDRLTMSNEVVATGVDVHRELSNLVQRRLLMQQRRNDLHFFPIVPTSGFEASLPDIAMWIEGTLDGNRILALARMLMAIDWDAAWKERSAITASLGRVSVADEWQMVRQHTGWATTRLCFHWNEISIAASTDPNNPRSASKHRVPSDSSVFARLVAGDGTETVQLAKRRLEGCGIRTRVSAVIAPRDQVRRWASSIAWSLSRYSINRLAQCVLNLSSIKTEEVENV